VPGEVSFAGLVGESIHTALRHLQTKPAPVNCRPEMLHLAWPRLSRTFLGSEATTS
jgi:hypothetical protein